MQNIRHIECLAVFQTPRFSQVALRTHKELTS